MNWLLVLLLAGPGGRHAYSGGVIIFAVLLLALLLGDWR